MAAPRWRAGTRRDALRGLAAAAAGCAGLAARPAWACRFEPSPLSWAERIEAQPLVFVGTVRSVAPGQVVFSVKRACRGTPGPQHSLVPGHGSCEHRYSVGQQWLFAGPSQLDPSVLLGPGEALPPEVQAYLRRCGC